jgi:hypothetical protein
MLDVIHTHSGELMILVLFLLVMITLIILVPKLLYAHLRKVELLHTENLKALDQGQPVVPVDEPSRCAGRLALLVPMVVMIVAATVTCFLVAYKSDHIFAVAMAVWTVAGIVSLAAITGGVALIGRLAQLRSGAVEEELPSNPLEE